MSQHFFMLMLTITIIIKKRPVMTEHHLEGLIQAFNNGLADNIQLEETIGQLRTVAGADKQKCIRISTSIDVNLLFSYILKEDAKPAKKNIDFVTALCDLLKKLFDSQLPMQVISSYGQLFVDSKNVTFESFQTLCLQQILRLSENQEEIPVFMSNPDIIMYTVSCIGAEHLSVAVLARKILNNLFDYSESSEWLFSDEIVNIFKGLLMKNSVVKFRVYEVFIDFVGKNPDQIERCNCIGIFNTLIYEVSNGTDVLSQLNALELLSTMAYANVEGLKYLEQKSLLHFVEKIVTSEDGATFTVPGAIKFYGIVASANPEEVIPKYKRVNAVLFRNIHSDDPSLKTLCAETVAHIASSSAGLKLLYANPDVMKSAVQTMSRMISNPGEDDYVRSRVAESLAGMFNHDGNDIEISMICEKLFRQIDNEPISYIFKLAQKPFLQLRYSVLKILGHVSKYSWAEQDMVLCAGFLEYLLNRKTETDKHGRELKFVIVKNLSVSTSSIENIGIDYHEKIVKYAQEGPFYSEGQVAVMYEEGS